MTESHSSQSSSSSSSSGLTIDLRPMIEDVSQVMTKHITNILTGVMGEYTTYKETHDTIMGLPCVRKLQERIVELESGLGGRRVKGTNDYSAADMPASATAASGSGSREDEVAQLQSAIAEMNRYIIALESKVDVKTAYSSSSAALNRDALEVVKEDEESVRLEIHEEDADCDNHHDESSGQTFTVSSRHKNVIVSATEAEAEEETEEEAEAEEEPTEKEADAEEPTEEEATEEEAEEAEVEAEEAEEEAEEEEAEEAETEEEAEEEPTEEEAEEAAEEEEEAETEEAAEEEEEAETEAEEAEIEVSEVKIKGKTYFTTDAVNGIIYACVDDDVGDEVGVFKNGVAVFNKGKK